jgi:hypothetical protein
VRSCPTAGSSTASAAAIPFHGEQGSEPFFSAIFPRVWPRLSPFSLSPWRRTSPTTGAPKSAENAAAADLFFRPTGAGDLG